MRETSLRHELKLVADGRRLARARSWIRLHPLCFQPAYPPRRVNNLYLDTPHLNSFNANQAGVSTRQKLRLRWYGPGKERVVQPVLELKCKFDLVGNKRVEPLDCKLDLQRPYRQLLHSVRESAGPPWAAWLNAASQPALINHYQRDYYVSADGLVRLTLDYEQRAYDQRLVARPNWQRPLPLTNDLIIEIKAAPEHGELLEAAMAHFPLPRSRNSKYIRGVAASYL